MKKCIGMLIIAGMCGSAAASVVTSATFVAASGYTGDSLDLFQGATITASSPTNTQFLLFDVRDIFSAGNPFKQEDVVFADTNGAVHHVEFNIDQPKGLRRINVVLINDNEAGDFSQQRSLINIKAYSRDTAGTFSGSDMVADVDVEENYTEAYGNSHIRVEIVFPVAVTGQYFRLEFEQPDQPWKYAPRVHEVDGYDWVFETGGVGTASYLSGDPLDDFQGATVTSNTATYPVPLSAPVADLFTAESPVTSDDYLIFSDTVGSAGVVDFNISDPRTVTNMTFTLSNDDPPTGGPHSRAVNYIKISASLSSGDVADHPIIAIIVDPDYQTAYSATNQTEFSIDFPAPVNAQYFRAEFGFHSIGARVKEIDGYGPVYVEPVFPATILSVESVSSSVLKMVIDAPGTKTKYTPEATTDLISVAGTPVAHSDSMGGPFVISNLDLSASEGTNEVIYVESDSANKFYTIEYAN